MTAETAVQTNSGSCLCGGVRYTLSGPLRPVVFCHCEQCRRTSGHYVAATACGEDNLDITNDDGLRWYRSSDYAERGFCRLCGGNLFYRPMHRKYVSVMAGTLDTPTGLRGSGHIFVASKSDYYEIADGLPQHAVDENVNLADLEERVSRS